LSLTPFPIRPASLPKLGSLQWRANLAQRLLFLALLIVPEAILFSVWLNNGLLMQVPRFLGAQHNWGTMILRCAIGFAALFITFGYVRNRSAFDTSVDTVETAQSGPDPIRWSLLGAHCAAVLVFAKLSSILHSHGGIRWSDPLAAGWVAAGCSAILFAAFTFISWKTWVQWIRKTGLLWSYAATAIVAASLAGSYFWELWQPGPLVRLTFRVTQAFLGFFVSGLVTNPAAMVIGTERFRVRIEPGCSGLEGIGLILVFGILWLLTFRKECRFPQSLVLLPLGVVVMFLFNAARIAALVLIGNAGAPQIAINGFHSQASWIAFSAVSVGFCMVIQRVSWFTVQPKRRESVVAELHDSTSAYLLPLFVILAAGMVAHAATGASGFEWLYPIRFIAAAAVLWSFRSTYRNLDWKFDWTGPVAGAVVFLIWIAFDRSSNLTADRNFSEALTAAPAAARTLWIAIRALAAVVTVPLAEELAFRGFLMRRLIAADFDAVPFRRFSWFALTVSSVAFGVLHGGYWLAGCIAGLLFGLVMLWRGRFANAVIAHATANALLAAYVLTYQKWHLW
jgi:exosortase E/protease (VPEID-CTERM system)